MHSYEYQERVQRKMQGGTTDWQLANFALGLTGEAGEVADHIKKAVFHGHQLDEAELVAEMGDVLWYVAALCDTLGVSLGDVMRRNVEKLDRRYPNGFDKRRSQQRQLERDS